MTKTQIRAAMMQPLKNAGIPHPIHWPNAGFKTPANSPWLRFTIFYPERTSFGLSQTDRQPVLVQIDIFTPKKSNDIAATTLADQVEELYPRNDRFVIADGFIQIEGVTTRVNPNDPNWFHTMVEVRGTAWGNRRG